ncbi:MAG: DUF4405 domain-containing protein [Firmicutes bacterium]|nr:DUF4405 domain-containing protein [Bacillota bacterium]
MKKLLHCAMIAALIFLCGSGMGLSRTQSLLHEWCGIVMFVCVLLHLIVNRRWFKSLTRGKYTANRTVMTAADLLLIVAILLIAVSSVVISGYIFASLDISGTLLGRRIHMVTTAWLFVISGIHYGMHLRSGKWNVLLYIAGIAGIVALILCRLYERLFLLNEFAFTPNYPAWIIYLLHALMFATFMALGSILKYLMTKKGKANEKR